MTTEQPPTPSLDLRQVQYFVTVADELSFSRAAARLHIATPSLSQQVKALERLIGVQLLVRNTRHVRLTAAGERFAAAGGELLRAAHAAVGEARMISGLVDGPLQLRCLHEAEAAFEPFLTTFHAAYPDIQVSVDTMRHAQLIESLAGDDVDAAMTWSFLLERGGSSDGLEWVEIGATEVYAALAETHPLAADDTVPRGRDLWDTKVVLFERDYSPTTFDYALEQLYGTECPDPPVLEVSVTVRAQEAMARAVNAGHAIAPLSAPVADLQRGNFAVKPFDPPWFTHGCVVWRTDHTSPALAAFTAAARAWHTRTDAST